MALTKERVLEFLQNTARDSHRIPTLREMAAEFGQRTTSSVRRFLDQLEADGYIVREASMARGIQLTPKGTPSAGLPILGRIAAGTPTDAIETDERLDWGATYDPECHFGLNVKGSSMIDAGICDGDLAIIRRQTTCQDGAIVAAVIEGEATLKRFFRRRGYILLKPENKRMKPIQVKDVEIRGVLVGLLRKF